MAEKRWSSICGDVSNVNAQGIPTSKVELSISCRNLIDLDIVSKSDPMCIAYQKDLYHDRYIEIGRTEQVRDNFNPDFIKKILIDYNFETVQKLRFELWDIDPIGKEFLGQAEMTLGEIVAYKGRQFKRPLSGHSSGPHYTHKRQADASLQSCRPKGRNYGDIIIVVEELTSTKQVATMQLHGSAMKGGFFASRNPFLAIWKSNEDGTYSVVYRTEKCNGTENPAWKPISCRIRTLCNGDFDRSIRFDVMNWKYTGDHNLIGSAHTTIRELQEAPNKTISLVHPKKKNRGVLNLTSFQISEELSFLDFIRNGTEMHFAVAIDFTASNGDIRDPRSLHFLDPSGRRPTSYEIALRAVGEIIAQYDSKGLFPGFGFGAKVPPSDIVSHLFPLNGNPHHPYCAGVEELISQYRSTLSNVTLYGPTNFAPVISSTASIAAQNQDGKNYFVLLIITDGIICDMPATKHAVVNASTLPLSIIICGVGDADFGAMDELDADDQPLVIDGRRPARDIVQFVPLNKFLNKQGNYNHSMIALAKDVLYEVPDQLTSYMRMKGFRPPLSNQSAPSAPVM